MKIEEALFSYLSTYAGLSAIVSTKIYPVKVAQAVSAPFVAYRLVSNNRYHALRADNGMASPVFEFLCFSTTYTQVKDIAYQVRKALQDYSGLMGGASGVTIQSTLMLTELEDYDDQTQEHFISLEFQFFYIE